MAVESEEWEPIDKPSPCWKYFLQNKIDGRKSICKVCLKIFKNPNNDTCRYHIEKVHKIRVPKKREQDAMDEAMANTKDTQTESQSSILNSHFT